MKKQFPHFHKIQYILKVVSSTISQILIYTTSVFWIWFYIEGVSWRDIFYNSKKIGFILKMSLQETLSTIQQISIYTKGVSSRDIFHDFTNFNLYYKCLLNLILYWRCLSKRHLLQFQKNWIYTKGVSSRDTFHNSTNFNIY